MTLFPKLNPRKFRERSLEDLLAGVPEGHRNERLHLGCGNVHLEGWCNIDFRETPATDKVQDVFKLPDISPGSAGVIYACHVLEHCGLAPNTHMPSYPEVLYRWFEVLVPGGVLFVAVPDLKLVFKGLLRFEGAPEGKGFLAALYGGQNYPGNAHFCGFTEKMLERAMGDAGFESPGPFRSFSKDTSTFILNGLPISLNLAAKKPTKSQR